MRVFRHTGFVVAFLVVFVAGGVVGVAGTLRWMQHYVSDRMDESTWKPRTMAWLQDDLALSPEQLSTLEPDVDIAIGELVELRTSAEVERRAIVGRLLIAINAELSAEQQTQLKEILRRRENEKKRWRRQP